MFSHVCFADTFHEILHLDSSKKTSGVIPIKILRLAAKETSLFLTNHFNECIDKGIFPDELKWTDIIPVHKKNDATDKTNY